MSVFTFDTDPPRVASPWTRPVEPGKSPAGAEVSGSLSDYGVTKLEAEPQEGPTEYKLHLLLRPRRPYLQMSTTSRVSGSTQSRQAILSKGSKSTPGVVGAAAVSTQTRQDRLMHLTTQLLWRLQQSCPYNPSSATAELVIPQLPDEALASSEAPRLGRLPPGLEASRGALYEIGVADDGTLVGLTNDEMEESLRTLQIMASSLGCNMEILRRVIVGDCDWIETTVVASEGNGETRTGVRRQGNLWVAEALVTPELGSREGAQDWDSPRSHSTPKAADSLPDPKMRPLTSDQLRVTMTGPTTSGKSTLLGTISTGILDNGRGKSRLLKHRHEVASGVTSSVAQEIVGYKETEIINYAHRGIESWIDIHDYTKDGRLVYLVDSAGHPRYRRTILRGIVGWAPQWALLCIAADDGDNSSGPGATASSRDIFGVAGAGVDLAQAHLDLCLQLETPLAIVITKYDLASKTSLHRVLGKVLSSVKKTGRSLKILQPDPTNTSPENEISQRDQLAVKGVIDTLKQGDLLSVVPLVLTSAVKGSGIGLLHALLQALPLPLPPTSQDYIGEALNPEQPTCLFHIEDRFSLAASYSLATSSTPRPTDSGTVVAGYLRFGKLSVGDRVLIGPFPSDEEDSRDMTPEEKPSPGSYGLSISHPSSAELSRIAQRNAISASVVKGELHPARIVSIRNLRLPVQTLEAGQVGSIGIVFESPKHEAHGPAGDTAPSMPRLRKGMVLAVPSQHMIDTGLSLQAASSLTASFSNLEAASLTVGSLVNVYIASVRSAARVLRVLGTRSQDGNGLATEDIDDLFNLNEDLEVGGKESFTPEKIEVQLELLGSREWIELGSRILVLEGGSRDRSGLEGYVGKVVEIVD